MWKYRTLILIAKTQKTPKVKHSTLMIIIKTHLSLKYVRNTDNQKTIYNKFAKFYLRNGKCLHLNLIIIFQNYRSPHNHYIYNLKYSSFHEFPVLQFKVKKAKDLAIESRWGGTNGGSSVKTHILPYVK